MSIFNLCGPSCIQDLCQKEIQNQELAEIGSTKTIFPIKQLGQQNDIRFKSLQKPKELQSGTSVDQTQQSFFVIQFLQIQIGNKVDLIDTWNLNLTINESKELEKGNLYEIDSQGLKGCSRKDGITVFGTQNQWQSHPLQIQSADLVIPNGSYGFGSQHFAVYFDQNSQQYFIVDLFQGNGTYMLLNVPLRIQSGQIVQFGAQDMTLIINQNGSLTIEFQNGNIKDKVQQALQLQQFQLDKANNQDRKTLKLRYCSYGQFFEQKSLHNQLQLGAMDHQRWI